MPQFGPIKTSDLVHYLRQAGFDGPFSGGKHSYMVKGQLKLVVPNPHHGEAKEGIFSSEYCAEPELTGLNGRNCKGDA